MAGLNVNRLPNKTLAFDLQSLNLHLSVRVSELVACREAMWEWVLGWQEKERERGGGGGGWIEEELRGMSRAEFEGLVSRFEMYVFLSLPSLSFPFLHFIADI